MTLTKVWIFNYTTPCIILSFVLQEKKKSLKYYVLAQIVQITIQIVKQ